MYIPPEKDRWRIATPMEIYGLSWPLMNRYTFWEWQPPWLSRGSSASFQCLYFEGPDRTKSLNGRDRKDQWVKTSVAGQFAGCFVGARVFFCGEGGGQKNNGKKIGEKRKKHLGVLRFVLGDVGCNIVFLMKI